MLFSQYEMAVRLAEFGYFDKIMWSRKTMRAYAGTIAAILVSSLLFTSAAMAQAQRPSGPSGPVTNAIAVMVNDEPVTLFDISQRERFLLATSGGVETEDQLRILRRRVVETLIEDSLKLQEAVEREFLNQIPEQVYEERFVQFAASVNLSAEQFADYLSSIGSSKTTLITQIKSQFVWDNLMRGLFGDRAAVGDDAVEDAMHRMEDSVGDFEYRLREIQLIVPSPTERARIGALAKQLANGVQTGEVSFSSAALQFSQSTSAANGGDLGWLSEDQMRREWAAAVSSVDVGSVSEPIASPGSFTILQVADRRRILTADPLDAQVHLHQIVMNFEADKDETQRVQAAINAITPLLPGIEQCEQTQSIASAAGFDASSDLGRLSLRDLTPELRDRVLPLEPVSATRPLLTQNSLMVLVVCDKQEPQIAMPEFEDIQRQLEGERLATFARRYLRDLKRDAVIDYRIPVENL